MTVRVQGLDGAQAALQEAMKDVDKTSEQMMTLALAAISANTKPYIPVDTSALINSEYRGVVKTRKGFRAFLGYGGASGAAAGASGTPVSEYAVYVHEGPQKNWQKPGASNQFLTKGVQDFIRDDLSGIIARFT
jgi:hypothetical protein